MPKTGDNDRGKASRVRNVVNGDFDGIQIGVVIDGSDEVINVVDGDTSGVLIQCDDFYGDINV